LVLAKPPIQKIATLTYSLGSWDGAAIAAKAISDDAWANGKSTSQLRV